MYNPIFRILDKINSNVSQQKFSNDLIVLLAQIIKFFSAGQGQTSNDKNVAADRPALVVDFFQRFEFTGGKVGKSCLCSHQLGDGFGKFTKSPMSSIDNLAVINPAGLQISENEIGVEKKLNMSDILAIIV
jgi:hypothetical protein